VLDKKTDEWVIHTPNLAATKFWPGSMGLMANYAVVFAKA
jgi:acyl-CoA oxidase